MDMLSTAAIALMCLTFSVGVFSLMVFLYFRERRHHLAFACTCFAIALYDFFSSELYEAASPVDGALWQRLQIVALLFMGIFLLWFVSEYIGRKSRMWDYVFSSYWASQIVLSFVDTGECMWKTSHHASKHVPLFGLTYQEVEPGILIQIQGVVMALSFLYILVSVLQYYRKGNRRQAGPLLGGLVLLGLGLFNDTAVNAGLYPFLYVIEYSYLGLVLCMGISICMHVLQLRGAVKESEERYRSFLEDFQGIAFRGRLDFQPMFFHGAVEKITGHKEQDFLSGRPRWDEVVHPADRARIEESMEAIRTVPYCSIGREYRIVRKDGAERWVYELIHNIVDKSGKPTMVQGTIYDITERKRAEEELKRLAAAVEAAAETIMITDDAERIVYANPSFERLTGYRRSEVMGRKPSFLKSGKHSKAFYAELKQTISGGNVWRGHFTNRKKDGLLYEEEAVISPIRDDTGKTVNYVAVKRDVTQELLLETELRQSQKMEAIGRLAGRVAHDFTNLLVIIQGNAGLAKDKLSPSHEALEYLESIDEASNRACKLTSQLLAFSHRQPMILRKVELGKAVEGLREMLQRTIRTGIKLGVYAPDVSCTVRGDPDHIEQVIVHMAINSSDAIAEEGVLTVEVLPAVLSKKEAIQLRRETKENLRTEGAFAVLSVSDSGCGMTPETMAHLFEPFFTTKGGSARGTGLGLSTVYGIVEQHEAYVTAYSKPDVGTTFRIYFRLVGKAQEELTAREAGQETPSGSGTVVVMDDDLVARGLLTSMCQSLGYSVLEAEDVAQAVQLAVEFDRKLDLFLADYALLRAGQLDVVREMKMKQPGMKVVLTSGFTRQHLIARGALKEEDPAICRPYQKNAVAQVLRRVSEASS